MIRILLLCLSKMRENSLFRVVLQVKMILYSRSRPVVHVEAYTAFDSKPKFVLLHDKKCKLQSGTDVACTLIVACMKYNGVNVDSVLGEKQCEVTYAYISK